MNTLLLEYLSKKRNNKSFLKYEKSSVPILPKACLFMKTL